MTSPFLGTCPALITPFHEDGSIDYPAFTAHLRHQLAHSPGALLIAGTTGEGSALSREEKTSLLALTKALLKEEGKRIPLMLGIASTSTAHAAVLAQEGAEMGADLLLAIPPAYVRTSEKGLAEHFKALSAASSLPILLYHVPQRTGQALSLAHFDAVAEHCPAVVGIKEASGSLSTLSSLHATYQDRFALYCGADEINLPALLLGAKGLISVLADLHPEMTAALCTAARNRDLETALSLHERSLPIVRALFSAPNPIMIKRHLAGMGMCEAVCRAPLS